ncbi:Lrp/AsnC family transcriptional regulator [Kutzneria sp. NPDC052558]|uniref:Lrp/AsnC family transcriptional regulator n=1 Tax=Kutzneria sp. NPDC052558 TaxID=3364121 RepID=UPI0037C8BD91
MSPDAIDLAIMQALDRDARTPMGAVADAAGVSRATAYSRVNRLAESGVLRRYTIDADPQQLGWQFSALAVVSGGQLNWRQLREELVDNRHVQWAAFLAGGFDVALLLRGRTMEEIRRVLMEEIHQLPGVRGIQTYFVLDEVVEHRNLFPN